MKKYINDFCEDLNYRKIILYVKNVSEIDLLIRLRKDMVNKAYRFNDVKENGLMYIENCDLQDVTENELFEMLEECFSVFTLEQDEKGFYIKNTDIELL